jgi:ferredoxin
VDRGAGEVSPTAVLVCSEAGVDLELPGRSCAVVDHLCDDSDAAGRALRALGTSRIVLGLCGARASIDHLAALRRAGATLLLRAAVAKLDALPPGERGRPHRPAGAMSRRSLFSLPAAVEHAPVAIIDAARCIGTASCGLCVPTCPHEAINGAGPVAEIDTAACTACGACVCRCPQGAIRLAGSSLAQLEAQLETVLGDITGVIFACASVRASAPRGWALIELPTLALITPGWLLQVIARGKQVKLIACGQNCCAGVDQVEAFVARIQPCASTVDQRPETPVRLTEPVATAEGALAIADQDVALTLEDPASPLGVVDVNAGRCTLCGACANACPTDALELEQSPDATALYLKHACVACRRCADVCPEGALEITRGLDLTRLRARKIELVSAVNQRCARCGSQMLPRQLRRRVFELLGHPDAPLELCAGCALSSRNSAS